MGALTIFYDVRERSSHQRCKLIPAQACKNQEDCRNAAQDLFDDLASFLSVEHAIDQFHEDPDALHERPEAKASIERILVLLEDIATFVEEKWPQKYYRAPPLVHLYAQLTDWCRWLGFRNLQETH